MKQVKQMLSAVGLSLLLTGAAIAQEIGVVDMALVSQKYTKAQGLATQVKTKEDELQKLRDNLVTQLKAGEKLSPVEKKNLEDKLNNQFATKFKEYREWTVGQEQILRQDFERAIQQVATSQKLDLVLPKQTVLQGGKDVTQDVINALNK